MGEHAGAGFSGRARWYGVARWWAACAGRGRGGARVRDEGRRDATALVVAARAPAGAGARVLADVRGDDQARVVRTRARVVSVGSTGAAVGRPRTAGDRRAVGGRWRAVCALSARAQAAAGVSLDRERRDHRPGARSLVGVRVARSSAVERDRVRGGAAAHAQPCRVQGVAVPGCRVVRKCRRRAGARSARRASAADAVDRGRVRTRGDGDRRPAAR